MFVYLLRFALYCIISLVFRMNQFESLYFAYLLSHVHPGWYSSCIFLVATRADVIVLQEVTGSILDAIGSVLGSHRKLEIDDVRGTSSSGDTEDGWENCGMNILWNDDLLHLIGMGFSNMKHEDYPQRGLLWARFAIRIDPSITFVISNVHMPW